MFKKKVEVDFFDLTTEEQDELLRKQVRNARIKNVAKVAAGAVAVFVGIAVMSALIGRTTKSEDIVDDYNEENFEVEEA